MYHWLLLVVMATVSRFQCCSCQSINIHPSSSIIKLKGGRVNFTCGATAVGSLSFYWFKDAINVTRGTAGQTNNKAYLAIANLGFSDAGRYSCHATGTSNTLKSTAVELKIRGSPDIIIPPSSLTSHVGYTVMFTCVAMATPNPTLTWYFDNGLISSGGRFRVYTNGTLVINTLTKADSGSYSCKVQNSLGKTSAYADLTVQDPPTVPTFTTIPNNITSKEGNEATFYCAASGIPVPTINWTRIAAALPVRRLSQPRPGALRIVNLIPSDTGLYACVAKNSQGQKIAYVYLGIEGFPRFIVSPSNKEIQENSSVSFSCVAKSDPKAKQSWQLPDNSIVSSLTNPVGNIRVLSNDTLVIEVVQERHQGIYKCIAKNSAGTKEAEAKLIVLTTPRFTAQLQNITKTRGDSLAVTCPARANPFPDFQWLFGGKIVSRDATFRLLAVNVSNQGYYTCRVNNSFGIARTTFYLRTIVPPVITLSPSNQTTGVGGTVRLSCRSIGDPLPTVAWYKSDVVIRNGSRYTIFSNNTLVIHKVEPSDRGWFMCRSINAAGRQDAKAYLLITDPPRFTALPSNKTVSLGESVVLSCRASAQENPRISWFKVFPDGRLQEIVSANVKKSGDLQISATQRTDRSRYVCQACNSAGCVKTPSVMLNVLYYPSFTIPPKNVGVLQGQDALLRCEPDASPKAKITWRKPNGEVFGGTVYEQIITNVQPGKNGSYECKAKNYLGEAGPVKIVLSIETRAVITDMSKVSSGATVTVVCKVQGTPSPSIVWYIEKIALPKNAMYPKYTVTIDHKLRVPIGSLDEKLFSCNATNAQNSVVYFVKAPGPPTSISASDITSNSLKVSWSRPIPTEYLVTHYQLEMSIVNSSWTLVSNRTKGLSYLVNKLTPFTWYMFRLKAFNGLGTSNYSMTSNNVRTLSSNPSAPQNLTLRVAGTSEIQVTWLVPRDLSGPLDGIRYRLVYYPRTPNVTNVLNFTHDKTEHRQEYSIVDLEADVRYSVNVFAWRVRKEDGEMLQSKSVSAAATTFQIVPKTPPIGLEVMSNGPHQIITKWQKPSHSVRGYNIWYMKNVPGVNFTKVNIPNGAATSYVLMDLTEDSVYFVKAQMYSNVADLGPFSEISEVRTKKDTFAYIAAQSQGESSISWKVAVGGLVCGIILLVIVIIAAWWRWKSTQRTNQTFRISRRRRRTSDPVSSSFASEGTTQGIYNFGSFNPELDNGLDLDMFENEQHVLPISTSNSNERDLPDSDSSQLNTNAPKRDVSVDNLYVDVSTEMPIERGNENDGTQNDYENPINQIPVYSQVDMTKKKNRHKPMIDENLDGTENPVHQIPVYSQVDKSKKTKKDLPDLDFPDYDSDEDISEIPYPEEDLPQLERTWTNVSEFNFPPPPNDPPPFEPESPSYTKDDEDERLNKLPVQADPPMDNPTNDTLESKNKEQKKKRMIASWADPPEEPIGNLWEAVDKELDRRLGTT